MLGKTAAGLYWMFRYLERAENNARLLEAGFRLALTRSDRSDEEWGGVLDCVGARETYLAHNSAIAQGPAIDFVLRAKENPSNVLANMELARNNARLVRTALSREVWEAVNESWMEVKSALAQPVPTRDLPEVLNLIKQRSAFVRGALHGTMLRNDVFNFARLGTFIERADFTARLIDVKYYVLLPSAAQVGSTLDNMQWEQILRASGGRASFRWLHGADISAKQIVDFLILDGQMPRSIAFCISKLQSNLGYLEKEYGERHPCHDCVDGMVGRLASVTVEQVFDEGLHEFILDILGRMAELHNKLQADFRFEA